MATIDAGTVSQNQNTMATDMSKTMGKSLDDFKAASAKIAAEGRETTLFAAEQNKDQKMTDAIASMMKNAANGAKSAASQ